MKQDLEPNIIHERYQTQAGWTAATRAQWFDRLALESTHRVLEVGSGTGVVISEVGLIHKCQTFGLDIDPQAVHFARKVDSTTRNTIGDGAALPYPAASFDASICHFLLLWLESPGLVLAEMKRVTRPGGWVLALAEPDYGGRIDYPDDLTQLGKLQEQALQQQGCDTRIGRKLRRLFSEQNLSDVCVGVLGGEWLETTADDIYQSEWSMLAIDLDRSIPPDEIENLKQVDQNAWREGARLLYVPTFYAGGQVQIIE
jgi:SAM-dependent methyltransferase